MGKFISLIATAVLVLTVWLLYFRKELFGTGPVTIALQVAAALLMVWARMTLGLRSFHATANATRGGLVTSGPYRYIRHPIYTAILLFVWTSVAAHPGSASFLAALVATAMSAARMLLEEQQLVQMYPEYKAYSARTARVIPSLL